MKMKQFLFCAMAFIAMMAFSTACVDSISENAQLSGAVQMIPFSVSVENCADTKATLGWKGNMLFAEGDKLMIEGEGIAGTLDLVSGGGTSTGSFSGYLEYSGAGTPSDELPLTARLVGVNDQVGAGFTAAIASSMPDAVERYSTLAATSTYGDKYFRLQQGTAYVEFDLSFDPIPTGAEYEAIVTNNAGTDELARGTVSVADGRSSFVLACAGGTQLTKPMISFELWNVKFGGKNTFALENGKYYTVEREMYNDLRTPISLKATGSGVISVYIPNDIPGFTGMWYSKDNINKTFFDSSLEIRVNEGDIVRFYGDNATYAFDDGTFNFVNILPNVPCYVYGNVMSLINSTDFYTTTELTGDLALMGLFVDAPIINDDNREIMLPATKLSYGCYMDLFGYCPSLTRGAIMLAETLSEECCFCMYQECPSLTDAPELPCTQLADGCYAGMFDGCTSLVNVPELPATKLAGRCYESMFAGCTSLVAAPELPAMDLADACYQSMFSYCTSLANAPDLPATILATSCYSYMFAGCKSLTTPPVLSGTILANSCYRQMFSGCTSLSSAPELNATELKPWCYAEMFMDCSSLTSSPDLPAETLVEYCYYKMFQRCSKLSRIKCDALDVTAAHCTESWTSNVRSEGVFIMPSGMTGWLIDSPNGVPYCWTLPTPILEIPLTFEGIDPGFVSISNPNGLYISYRIGEGPMTSSSDSQIDIAFNAGDQVHLFGNTSYYRGTTIDCTADCYIYGNIMSLISSSSFATKTTLTEEYVFQGLFRNNVHIKNHATYDLVLPARYLERGAYSSMFLGCTGLTRAPELPATRIYDATICYASMFKDCTGLTRTPDLPAKTLASQCYHSMFEGCTGLISAGEISATSTAVTCCQEMFKGCINLKTAPALHAMNAAGSCYESMFEGCTSLEVAPALPATDLGNICYRFMFKDCSSLKNAPALPATTISDSCYDRMFMGCSSLERAPSLPALVMQSTCYNGMFNGCTSLTAAPALPATTLASRCYSGMFAGCTNLQNAPNLPATDLFEYCYSGMFNNCSSLTSAPALPAMVLQTQCYYHMFNGCTSLTAAPDLLAPVLVKNCYTEMFQGCSSLKHITCLATDITADRCTYGWVDGVSSSGTFVKAPSMTSWPTSSSGIPAGWTVSDAE